MTVEAIQEAIQQLPPAEQWNLASWLEELRQRAWDEEMERDFSPGGRGEWLFGNTEAEPDKEGDVPLEDFLEQVKNSRLSSRAQQTDMPAT